MKVIKTDNFDRGSFSDKLIKEDLTRQDAQALANKLNDALHPNSKYWHEVVEDDTKLFVRTE